MTVPALRLADGHRIPQIGLGTWKLTDKSEFDTAFESALDAGYRHVDTAQAYDNERLVGAAWRKSGLKREELFITTKINVINFGHDRAKRSFSESLKNLQTEYVDL